MYECEEGCSKCCGPKEFNALTSNRIISRYEEGNCCCYCFTSGRVDTAIYLRDIEILQEGKPKQQKGWWTLFLLIITCTWPLAIILLLFSLCCACCGCCGDQPKHIGVRGAFGEHTLTFKNNETIKAMNEISAMIQPYKARV